MTDALWITERDVVELMALPEAIAALRAGLAEEAAGQARNMVKTHVDWGDGATLHAIGAAFDEAGVVGTKTWAHTPGGAAPLLVLFDAASGAVRAVIEAFALGQMRTGGISGVATDLLARPDAKSMAIIGAGKQSLAQVAAVAAVRRLDQVAIWSPTAARSEALRSRVADELGVAASVAATLEAALDGADIVTLATRARAPFLGAAALARGVHLNAIGAITPERAEFDPALLDRATLIAADSVSQVRKLSREFQQGFGEDEAAWRRVVPLSALVARGAARDAGTDLSLFKAMGIGMLDVALGIELLARAQAAGLGRPIASPTRVAPRFAAPGVQKRKM